MKLIVLTLLLGVGCSLTDSNKESFTTLTKGKKQKKQINAAKLPKQFIKPKAIRVGTLKVGEEGYTFGTSLWLHKDGTLWLNPSTILYQDRPNASLLPIIKIKKTKRGIEVELISNSSVKLQLEKSNFPDKYVFETFLPVIKFSVEDK